jgi:hypothetical protein
LAKSSKSTGRWKIVASLGGGGQAEIFTVVDDLGEHSGAFALKRLKNANRQERFTREIAALRRLNGDPNIITLIDADDAENPSWFVMALGDGSLEDQAPAEGYSLGKLLYWLLNRMILPREKLRHRKYALPGKREHQALDEFARVIEHAIAENRASRTASVEKLLETFEAALTGF